MTVYAAQEWKHNGELIATLHEMGYIRDDDLVLDMTFGKGVWWKSYRPPFLTTNDLDVGRRAKHHYNYKRPPRAWLDLYDVVAFDPAYVSPGGRATTTLPDFHERYGMSETPRSPQALHTQLIVPGLMGCYNVTRPGGLILHKTQDYISSGRLQPASHWAYQAGTIQGLALVDEFVFLTRPRPQPKKNIDGSVRRQVHAHRNYSVLYIWKKI